MILLSCTKKSYFRSSNFETTIAWERCVFI